VRRVAAAVLAVVACSALALVLAAPGGTDGSYRVDAIFDNASFLIPGQDVKIAGARAGHVVDVRLVRVGGRYRARVEMAVDSRFAPFRSDADCTIQPQSLIGEKFVQCTPGTPAGHALTASGGQAPTVGLDGTHSPVDLDLVLATFRRPVNERLSLLLGELGSGLAARGEDLNDTIRRANPALQEANRVLGIVAGDRRRLRALIGGSRRVLDTLAARRHEVAATIVHGARVTTRIARHRGALEQTVQGLPQMLLEARPTLVRLQELTDAGTPILGDVQAAAPQLERLSRAVPALVAEGRPALDRLGQASAAGATALHASAPLVALLRRFAAAARPTGGLLATLLQSLHDRGVVEGLQTFTYYAALATSRYDEYSHIIPAHLLGSECSQYATTPTPGCDSHFVKTGAAARTLDYLMGK
jgi:ABC-type transporter Mla subunit MlaD